MSYLSKILAGGIIANEVDVLLMMLLASLSLGIIGSTTLYPQLQISSLFSSFFNTGPTTSPAGPSV